MSQADIAIKVTADTSQAERGLNELSVNVHSSASKIDSLVTGLGKIGMAHFGIKSVTQALKAVADAAADCIQTFGVQEQAEARLGATLQATNNEIGMSVTELGELASSLQAVTTYGDETILGMESLFIATRQISKEVLPEATERALDMATAMGTDATSAAQKLARVLADPINNVRSLKEANIQLTDAQKEEIAQLQEQGDLLDAQKIILQAVSDAYGGIAKSVAETDTGKLTQIENVWGDIKEGIGESLLNTVSPALDALYESLNDIYTLVDEHNGRVSTRKQVESVLESKDSSGLSGMSDAVLQGILDNSGYVNWKNEAERSGIDTSNQERIQRGLQIGKFTQDEIDLVNAVWEEVAARKAVAEAAADQAESVAKTIDYENLSPAQERLLFAQSGIRTGTETEIIPTIKQEIDNKNIVDAYLSSAGKDTVRMQIKAVEASLAEAKGMLDIATDNDKQIIQEIIDTYSEKLTELQDSIDPEKMAAAAKAAAKSERDAKIDKASTMLGEFSQPVTSFVSALSDLWSNVGDQFESQLDKIQKKWESFFDSLEREQTIQKDSLQMALSQGLISYDEYITARQQMDDEYANAQAEAETEQENIRKKADEAKKKAFEADKINSIAQIGIAAAQAIMNAWKYDPVTASILTGMISATSVAQIAAVSSKQYTPLAAGGIVDKPTYALIGEGGSKEAVLPLNEDAFRKAGLSGEGGNRIVITFNFGSVYSKEELVSDVFESVEMLQRSGALPKWSYA